MPWQLIYRPLSSWNLNGTSVVNSYIHERTVIWHISISSILSCSSSVWHHHSTIMLKNGNKLKTEKNWFLYHQSWSSNLKVQLEQLKYWELDSHIQVYWIFWEIILLKNRSNEIWAKYGQWWYRFKFLEEIRLRWLFYVGFGEIRFLEWSDSINSNFWLLAMLKVFSEGLPLFKLKDSHFPGFGN